MFLQGSFGLISPAALLQSLCQERRSVEIVAWRGASEAQLAILEGLVVGARCDTLRGPEAVHQFAAWDFGHFHVGIMHTIPEETEMAGEWEELLLEGARMRDELEQQLAPPLEYPSREELEAILALCPALDGIALVGFDGTLLGAIGVDDFVRDHATDIALRLDAIGRLFARRAGVMLYAGGGRRVLMVTHSAAVLIGLPHTGVSIADATAQMTALVAA